MSQKFLGNFSIIDHSFHRCGKRAKGGGGQSERERVRVNEWILVYFNMTKFICNMISIFIFFFFAFIYSMYRKLACLLCDCVCVCMCVSVGFCDSCLCLNTITHQLLVYVFYYFSIFRHEPDTFTFILLTIYLSNSICFANKFFQHFSKNTQKIEWHLSHDSLKIKIKNSNLRNTRINSYI